MSTTVPAAASHAYNPKATEAGGDPSPPYTELQSMVVHAYEEFEKNYKAASKAFAEALSGSAASGAFVKDMDSLRLTIGTLNTLFGKVETELATIDAEKLHDESGKVIEWQPQWRVIRSTYTNIALKSRSLATGLSNRVEMFFKTVLPKLKGDTLTAQQKEEMLTYFLGEKVDAPKYNEALKWDEKAADQMYKDFVAIRTDVSTFKAKFDACFKPAQEQLRKVPSLQSDMAKIKADLEALTAKARVPTFRTSHDRSSLDLLVLIEKCAHYCSLDALGGDIPAGVLQKQISDKRAESNNNQAESDAASAKQERLNMVLKPLVASPDKDMIEIDAKLETMKNIWSFIKSQAQTARLEVQKPIGSEAPGFLKDDLIDASIAAYKVLNTCVKMYGEGFEKAPQ